ncbi:MAG: hypothetical protein GQ529_04230 [Methyloprofundus sp.]|nr:hypothetical protein [Methyloprofundus sp.]
MLTETIETSYLHLNRAKDNYEEMLQFSIDLSVYQDKEKIKTIDAFIFRFIKLQDFMGDKLFKEVLKVIGEYKDNMALIDCLDKLEKLEIIAQADRWMNYRAIRNKLTHEYSTNQEEMLAGIQLAMVYFKEINEVLNTISNYLQEKQLI